MPDGFWTLNQQNEVKFPLDDANGIEQAGLGTTWVINLSPPGNNPFAVGLGTKAEISNGWYHYLATALEANAIGDVAIFITHATIRQQNLVYTVQSHASTSVLHPYTVKDGAGDPLEGVEVIFHTNTGMTQPVWRGVSNTFGITVDEGGAQPFLDPGTYFVQRIKAGFNFANPDTEVVS